MFGSILADVLLKQNFGRVAFGFNPKRPSVSSARWTVPICQRQRPRPYVRAHRVAPATRGGEFLPETAGRPHERSTYGGRGRSVDGPCRYGVLQGQAGPRMTHIILIGCRSSGRQLAKLQRGNNRGHAPNKRCRISKQR